MREWGLTHHYGLFRSMTGVGDGGVVARPEVVLQGSMDGQEWRDIEFRCVFTHMCACAAVLSDCL
jgi:Lipase maturation factor